ncbi:MAG: NAD(P)-dependent oxidoreductase, partial [Deltaproteobacteria bacterium]|nr:NAD(P)-dependent oxidoreductase [Deltaproteobacteria bacterium]
LIHKLLAENYSVRVIDSLKWGGESLLSVLNHPRFEFLKGDIRNRSDVERAVRGVEAVIHMAAIVGDPACKKEPELARETNVDASIDLYHQAKKNGVLRFIFSSTCSNYGKMKDPSETCREETPLQPVSLYAELKVRFEQFLLKSTDDITATVLRFSTAYGLSPRMRFDLTVSEFTRDALTKKELIIYGEQFWRPYCHTQDLAEACLLMLNADRRQIDREAFNVGDNRENYQKKMLAEEIQKQVPDFSVQYVQKIEDPRDYRVNFDKIAGLGYKITQRVPNGIAEVVHAIKNGIIQDPFASKYSNI